MLTTTEQEVSKDIQASKLDFKHYPAFARFIRENHLRDYVADLLEASREAKLPIMKYLQHLPEDQLMDLGMQGHGDFLTSVENRTLDEYIQKSLKNWERDEIGVLNKDEIGIEDITRGSYVRKKVQLKYLQLYTGNLEEILAIIKEIDLYDAEAATASTNTYIRILHKKIHEHTHFIESITNTTPSIIYVYDRENRRELYSNSKMTEMLGFTQEDLQEQGTNIIQFLVHPDDVQRLVENEAGFGNAEDGEIRSIEYRIKDKSGKYRWMRAYESVFKRNTEGAIVEKIGVSIDIDTEKKTGEQLRQREQQLLEAQELVNMGSYVVDLDTGQYDVTPQYLRIFEIEGRPEEDKLMKGIHPGDRMRVTEARNKAIAENGLYECEYRYLANGKEKVIWARATVVQEGGKKIMKETVIDVTDRHYMIQKLLRSETLYKQAQAMSHIGNWVWDILHNKFEWSDELYNIYEFDKGSPVDYEALVSCNHPEDDARIRQRMRDAMEDHKPYEFTFRVILPNGKRKTLQATGEVMADEDGKPYKLLGTLQDITEQQNMMDRLRESDKLFRQAQAISHVGNWTWNIADNSIMWTDELYRIFGLEPEDKPMSYDRYEALLHPQDRQRLADAVLLCRATHEPYEILHRVITPAGETKYVLGKGQVILDGKGTPVKMFGTSQDVTERQTLIEQLRYNEKLYKEAQALAHLGNFTHNLDTDEITWTDEIYRIYGLDPQSEALTFDKVASFIHPDDMEYAVSHMKDAIKKVKPYDCRYRILLKDGTVKMVHRMAEVAYDEHGKPTHLNGTLQDITKEYLAEQELVANREFIEKIANTTPSLIAAYNINTGKYSFINSAIEKILGYSPQKILDEGIPFFLEIIHPDDLAPIMEKNSQALEDANNNIPADGKEPIVEFKYRLRHKDGHYHWFHTYGTIFERNEKGQVEQVLNVSVDITEQEEAEQKLQQKNMELQQSNASLAEYAYVASHDLKEPLRKIATFGDRLLMTQKERMSDEGKIHLEKIITSSRRMQAMINDLLAVSMISGEKGYEPSSLQTILADVSQTLEYKIDEKKAVILADNLPVVTIVPSQFRQLFQNLISNSLKFTNEGVTPRITITHRYLKPQDVQPYKLMMSKRYLQIQLADNGIGFDNQFANKIFTIFQRLHGRNEYEGTGIGLAICKKVAENHGGTIMAEGTQGKGSVFTIIIPA